MRRTHAATSAHPRRRGGHGASCAGVACEHTLGRQPLHLYGYLWAKPEFVADDKSGTFSFVVPDTVLFKQQKPVKWFFTSGQEKGKILIKSKKNLTVTHVLSAFLEPKHFSTNSSRTPATASASGAVSVTTTVDDDSLVVATYTYVDRSSSGEIVLVVEHLTRTALNHLLTTREKPTLSVLQRFIPTRSGYNHLIQTVFTPDSCLIRKCVSSQLVSDTRLCVAERTATFEADERHVQPREVTNRELSDQIEHMHLEMSTHLQKIIGKPVARHVAYFKVGADDRIYLLWSSMLSFETGQLAFAKNLRLSLSHQDRLQHLVATTAPGRAPIDKASSSSSSVASSHALTKTCPRCRTNMPRRLVDFYATYKAVIKSFKAEPRDPLAQNVSCIPPLLDQLLSPISEERFKELSQEPAFLYRMIALCQTCAKHINTRSAKKSKESEAEPTPIPTKPQPERAKPIYMQSAHSIFWGRVERQEDAERKRKMHKMSVVVRPASAGVTTSSRGRSSAVGGISDQPLTHKQSAEGLTRATFKRLLPLLASQAAAHTAQTDEPKHCMQKLAEHLHRTHGGPSVRLALARASIYPPTALVSLDMLQWVCEPKLLADVFTYWTEFCKVNDSEYSSSAMDLDALDAMLSVYATSNDLALKSRAKATHIQPNATIEVTSRLQPGAMSTTSSIFALNPSPLLHPVPVRPSSARPSSGCVSSRNSSVRSARVIVHAANPSRSPQKPVPDYQRSTRPRPPPQNNQVECAGVQNDESVFPSGRTRTIDGVECEVNVAATQQQDGSGLFSLTIRVRPIEQQQQIETGAESHTMSLTLDTQQILDIVSRSTDSSLHRLPPTGDALVAMVLDALSLQHGYLSVLPRPPPPVSLPGTSPHWDSFTNDELRLLHETLLHAQPPVAN